MNVNQINDLLASGEIDREDLWPKIREAESKAAMFRFDFGLDELPVEPGVIVVRGPRQYGKSTWLELSLRYTIVDFGKGTAFYVNGDELTSEQELYDKLSELDGAFARSAKVRRIFVDEVTAVPRWEHAIKRLVDQGKLRQVLVVTTGSKAFDLRRGVEKLPGRKGKLKKTEYVFLPISFKEFHEACGRELGDKTWMAYLLTGGSPIACNDIFQFEHLPDYFIEIVRDWMLGETIASGRSRVFFMALMRNLFRYGGAPLGYAKLARETGLANNTVAAGYVEQLSDLLCVLPAWQWDESRSALQMNKPCKFNFINLAAAIAFHPRAPRYVHEFEAMPPQEQAVLIEWLVAQELWRRAILSGHDNAEAFGFWRSEHHEIDFVTPAAELIEVKRGRAGPLDFGWFHKTFPKRHLTVVCASRFETDHVRGIPIQDFLLQ